MTGTERSIQFRGTTVRAWVHGSADKPWLAISHGMALDSASFLPLIERLSGRWRVLRWDFPGHGKSGPLPDPFDMNGCVDAFEAVLADAGVDKAALLGFSFGGIVAQLFARRQPERVSALIAYGCLTPLFVKPFPAPVRWLGEWHVTRGDWDATRARFAAMCSIKEPVRKDVVAAMASLNKVTFRRMAKAFYGVNAYEPTARFACPLMYVRGDQDANNPFLKIAEAALRKGHPSLTTEIVPEAGHCAHQDNPEAFIAAIERFLARIK